MENNNLLFKDVYPSILRWNRVKVFENLNATEVVKVAPVDTSLQVKAKHWSASGNVLPLFDVTK